ncbi:hypothetical protein Tco_0366797 [Tanacetum coccineum]
MGEKLRLNRTYSGRSGELHRRSALVEISDVRMWGLLLSCLEKLLVLNKIKSVRGIVVLIDVEMIYLVVDVLFGVGFVVGVDVVVFCRERRDEGGGIKEGRK